MADASFPDILARCKPGIAIAEMIPMIATTISNSMSVNPLSLFELLLIGLNAGN